MQVGGGGYKPSHLVPPESVVGTHASGLEVQVFSYAPGLQGIIKYVYSRATESAHPPHIPICMPLPFQPAAPAPRRAHAIPARSRRSSDLVICHAGAASIFEALRQKKVRFCTLLGALAPSPAAPQFVHLPRQLTYPPSALNLHTHTRRCLSSSRQSLRFRIRF